MGADRGYDDKPPITEERYRSIMAARERLMKAEWPMPAPVLNGITTDEVSGWFGQAAPRWTVPDDGALATVRFVLDHVQVQRQPPKPMIDLKPVIQKLKRIRDALSMLKDELPPLIESAKAHQAQFWELGMDDAAHFAGERAALLDALCTATTHATAAFLWPVPKRRRAYWTSAAMQTCRVACEAWHSTGRAKIGLKPTSPAVGFVRLVLARIDREQTADAISQCLIRARRSGTLARLTPKGDN